MKNKSSYSESAYGKMRDRIKEREEKEKKTGKGKFPYRYFINIYA